MICDDNMQHGQPWRGEDVAGWYVTEKLDGCRGYWDGSRMFSRSGRVIPIPAEWGSRLPHMHLDGEIWAGRGNWDLTVQAVVRNQWDPRVGFFIFDAPQIDAPWPKRLQRVVSKLKTTFAAVVPHQKVRDISHVAQIFRAIRIGGGEGLMLWHPARGYSKIRTNHVLKVKRCPLTGELAWRERRFGVAA